MLELMLVTGIAQSEYDDLDLVALIDVSNASMEIVAKDWGWNGELYDEDISKLLYKCLIDVKEDIELLIQPEYFEMPLIRGTVADLNGMGCSITIKEVGDAAIDLARDMADDIAMELLLS